MAFGSTPKTWTSFYAAHRDNGGIYEHLFNESAASILNRSLSHFESPTALTESIAGYPFGVMMLVSFTKGTVDILHHGFTYFSEGSFQTAFIKGNLKESSRAKQLDREGATSAVRPGVGRRLSPNCPLLEQMIRSASPEAFANLPSEANQTIALFPQNYS